MKLQSEWAVIPNICPLCKQQREPDEYCMLVSTTEKSHCVIQKKTDAKLKYENQGNIRFVTKDGWIYEPQ